MSAIIPNCLSITSTEFIIINLTKQNLYVSAIKKIIIKLYFYHQAGAKEENKYSSYLFLTLALHGVSGQCHCWTALYSWERTPGIQWIGSRVDLRAGLDT
jgi:hypothetical protein